MKFMTMIKGCEGLTPPPALFAAITDLASEAAAAGVGIDMGGLLPTALGARVRLAGGKITITDGPFTEAKEVIGGYAILDVRSKDEAIRWTARFMDVHAAHWPGWEGETEIRQLAEEPPPSR